MDLQCQLLLYFDKRRYLDDMKLECEKFLEEQTEKTIHNFPPLRFQLNIDVMDLLDAFAELGMYLIQEPWIWQCMCTEILFACLQATIGEDNQHFQRNQCLALIRLRSLSKLHVRPNQHHYSGLVTIEGILISISKPTNYVYHTVWSCPEECEKNEVVFHYNPKAPPKCYCCKSVLFENSSMRRCGEKVTATFKLDQQSHLKNLTIKDDLISKLTIGLKYSIHAVVSQNLQLVWSVEEFQPLAVPMTSPVLKDIQNLHKSCDGLPWKFIYCLASSVGLDVCPCNCFMHLKICLLMSLCSVKASALNGSDIMHVLAAGFDTGYAGELMINAAGIADRFISLGTSNTKVSTALLASSGGVFTMPLPLHVYNQKQTHEILATVEGGVVNTETGNTKLRSAVWAQGMDFKKIIVYNVANVFGTVCRGDVCEYHDEINDFNLESSVEPMEPSSEEKQTFKELASYIDLVAGIEVSMDIATENLLRNYFLAARKEGPRSVSVGGMKSLVAACVTSAKLCRRPIANVDDAVFAIWLHVSGGPGPRFAPEEYLQTPSSIKKVQKMMNSFKEWLEQFTGTLIFN